MVRWRFGKEAKWQYGVVAPVCKASNIAVRSSSNSVRSSRLTYFDIIRSDMRTSPPSKLVAVSTISYQPSPVAVNSTDSPVSLVVPLDTTESTPEPVY